MLINREIVPCLIALKFAKKIVGLDHNIIIDTQLYKLNASQNKDFSESDDIFKIFANPQYPISIISMCELFQHMTNQYEKLNDLTTFCIISSIKYNHKKKKYCVEWEKYDNGEYTMGPYNCNTAMTFAYSVICHKDNIFVDSTIFRHNIHAEGRLDINQDHYELFGNDDKRIDLDDVIDLFEEMDLQFKEMIKKKICRSYILATGVVIDNQFDVHNYLFKISLQWSS